MICVVFDDMLAALFYMYDKAFTCSMNARVSFVCLALFCLVDRYVCLFGTKDAMLYARCMLVSV